jgi:hypothetical protein
MMLPRCLLLVFVLAAPVVAARVAPAEDDPRQWVTQLESPLFADRTEATRELRRMGRRAIPYLLEAIRQGNFEARRRAVTVLHDLALSGHAATEEAVLQQLAKLADDAEPRTRFVAENALDAIREERQTAALVELRRYGAEISSRSTGGVQGLSIHFGGRWHGGEKRIGLVNRLNDVVSISIEDSTLGDGALPSIVQVKGLRWLYLGNSRITGKGLEKLAALQELQHLSLRNQPITDNLLKQLPPLPQLQALGLDGTQVSNASLDHLAQYAALRTLWLDRTQVTAAGLADLAALPNLSLLYLSNTDISGPGLKDLQRLPQLQSVSLKSCTLTPDDLARLSGLEQLDMLGMDHTNVTDEHLARLNNLPRLRTLWLSKTAVSDASIDKIASFKQLQTLYLHGSAVSEHGVTQIQSVLPGCKVYR